MRQVLGSRPVLAPIRPGRYRRRRTRAVSIWAAVAGGAAVLGLLTSGFVLEVWSWPAVFGLNVILAAAAMAVATLLRSHD